MGRIKCWPTCASSKAVLNCALVRQVAPAPFTPPPSPSTRLMMHNLKEATSAGGGSKRPALSAMSIEK